MDGQRDGQRNRWTDGGRDGWADEGMDGWTEGQRDGWMDGETEGWVEGSSEEGMGGGTDGERDKRMGGMEEGTGRAEKEPCAPLPHLDIIIEFPEAFVSQNLVYRRFGHFLQPCSRNNGAGILSPPRLGQDCRA